MRTVYRCTFPSFANVHGATNFATPIETSRGSSNRENRSLPPAQRVETTKSTFSPIFRLYPANEFTIVKYSGISN